MNKMGVTLGDHHGESIERSGGSARIEDLTLRGQQHRKVQTFFSINEIFIERGKS